MAPLLAHEDETARYYALWALSAIGPDAQATLPRILELASDPDDDVRDKAVYALGKDSGSGH